MNILHTVEFYYPSIGGMQEVVKQISERLVKRGHKVTVATTKLTERRSKVINGVKIKEFEIKGNLVRGLTGETKKYIDFLTNSDFDIMTNFAAQQWASDLAFDILDRIRAKKVFVPQGFSGYYLSKYSNYFVYMKSWMKKYNMNIFHSENYRDVDFARQLGIKKMIVLPHGAGEDEFSRQNIVNIRGIFNIPISSFFVLHVGSHTGLKGHKEAIKIFERAKISTATFLIIGNSFGGGCTRSCEIKAKIFNLSPKRLFDKKKIIVAYLSREETLGAYRQADLFLFPSNIECSPLVLFECMASRTPFLTTDVGNAKEIISWSKSGILLPTISDSDGYSQPIIDESARLLEMIYGQTKERKAMADLGYSAWKRKFRWETIAKSYENVYVDLMSRP